ncbi:MAG TPA: Na+/H+ antiporter subunit E [Egibacteraceae bacterium]|nr:Na+/H+ antiporter subunit E [Egibacteraceae bacterium]
MGHLWLTLWLVIVWIALQGEVTVGNVIAALLVAGGLQLLFPTLALQAPDTFRPLKFVRFFAYFAYKLVEASIVVAWEVVTPRNRLNQGIVAVPVRGADALLLTTLANTISLTPGTLTLEVRREPPTLYVHVMHIRSVEHTRNEVLRLEELMLDAFAPHLAERLHTGAQGDTPWRS